LRIQLLRHAHHGVGAERMADQHIGSVIAGAVHLCDAGDDDVGEGVVINAGVDAAALDLRGELIHAERENVQQSAHKINVRPRYGLMCCDLMSRSPMRGRPSRTLRAGRQQHQSGEEQHAGTAAARQRLFCPGLVSARHRTAPPYATHQLWRRLWRNGVKISL
jgi:hypothetical protein